MRRAEIGGRLLSYGVSAIGHDILLDNLLMDRNREAVLVKIVLISSFLRTYVGLELSLENLSSLLADSGHGTVLVDFSAEFTSCVGGNFGDGAATGGDWHVCLRRNMFDRVL